MKQQVTFVRIETVTLRIDVPQALAKATLEQWARSSAITGISAPRAGELISHTVTEWEAKKAEPGFLPAEAGAKALRRKR